MKQSTVKHLVALLLMLMAATSSSAQQKEAYVVYDTTNKVLTFYYDNLRQQRPGSKFSLNTDSTEPEWCSISAEKTKVVFDPSFAGARPTSTYYWFAGASNGWWVTSQLETIEGIEYLNTSEVTNMSRMFYACDHLQELDVSHFNTAKVTDMSYMFYACSVLTSLDVTKFNTAKVTDMSNMFSLCRVLTSLNVANFNTANVTSMSNMFSLCEGLTSLNVTSFNTANVTDMSQMFGGCWRLTSLNVTKFNTANVTNMYYMFSGCQGLTSLDVTKFDTGNVTNMTRMFNNCRSLKSIDPSGWETGNVTDMEEMFQGCSSLVSLDLSGWDTGNVTEMYNMFGHCSSLKTIYCGDDWSTANFSSDTMFEDCFQLVGGAGTVFKLGCDGVGYAHVDGGPSNPGYLTYKAHVGAYAVYNNGVLTFYYDKNRAQRPGTAYRLNKGSETPKWSENHSSEIKKVVFHDSFAGARPKTTHKWFGYMSYLETFEGLGNLNTSEVTDMSYMFCNLGMNETPLNLSGWDTSNVTDMSHMFETCAAKVLDLSSFNTRNVTRFDFMFFCSHDIKTIYCGGGWYVNEAATGDAMFMECYELVGGQGTEYLDYYEEGVSFAHADGGPDNPGYLTLKSVATAIDDAPCLNEGLTNGNNQYFGIDGTRLSGQHRGLNLVRKADGTVKKVLL